MRQTHISRWPVFIACISLFGCFLSAQPSGGPYGPVAQYYSLPEADVLYFASPDGNPQADGKTQENPTTLENAITRATTGDAVILRGGLYRAGNIRFNQGITIQPLGDEKPVLTGTEPLPASQWQATGEGLWRTEWTKLFPAAPADWWRGGWRGQTTPRHRFNYDMVFANEQRLVSVGSPDEVNENSCFIDYENGLVFIGLDPSDYNIEITAHDSALVRTIRNVNGQVNDKKGPVIRGIVFQCYARLALLIEGIEPNRLMDPSEFGNEVVGSTLEHVTIAHCSRVAGYFRGNGLTIRHCLVSDCGSEGIYVINSSDVLLERNMVTRTNSHAPLMGYYASAIKIFNQSHRVTCRDNLVIDNPYASGIWFDVGNRDVVAINNWVERTNEGFFMEISHDAICAGNVFVESTPGVRILNSANVSVYQNTFYNSTLEIARTMRSSEGGDHFGWHASTGPAVARRDGHTICNNLFLVDEPIERGIIQYFEQPGMEELVMACQLASLDGNVYVRQERRMVPVFVTGTFKYPGPEFTFEALQYLADIRGQFPEFETHGQDYAEYRAAVIRNAALRRFELLPSFPGADNGVPLPEKVRGLLDWKQNTKPFPGAWPVMDDN